MKLSPVTALLLRSVERIHGEHVLVLDSPGGELGLELARQRPDSRITLIQTDYPDYRAARERLQGLERANTQFCAWYSSPSQPHDCAVIHLPKGRAALDMVLDMVAGVMATGAPVYLAGPTRGGIRSAARALERGFGPADKLDVARRCALYVAAAPSLDRQPALERWGETREFEIAGRPFHVHSLPGVFSHGRLDDGTRLLLETLDGVPAGDVLDFGCGSGVIGAWIHARHREARVELVDASAFALEAARRTATLNGLPASCVRPSDIFSDVTGRYAMIISNPPFHAGITTDYAVVQGFLEGVAARLVPGGALRLVANRFHRYAPFIREHVGPCRSVAEDSRYRVYEAVLRRAGGKR